MNTEEFSVLDVISSSNYTEYEKQISLTDIKSKAIAYLRYSTKRQFENSPIAQLNDILKYALNNSILIEKKNIFLEDGKSGKLADKRPEFQKMINYITNTKTGCNKLLVHKYDRFARNKDESGMYKVFLKRAGIEMIAVAEILPEDKQMALVVETQYEMNSQLYSMRLSNEVYKGMRIKAQKGEHQTKAIYGYKKIIKEVVRDTNRNRDKIIREMIICEEEAKIVRMIFEKYINGMSAREIAIYLNNLNISTGGGTNWTDNRVNNVLDNITYTGYVHWTEKGKETIVAKGNFPIIIDNETWTKKEEIRKLHKNVGRRIQVQKEHWLRGKIRCSNCGNVLVINGGSYQCCAYTHGACKISHSIRIYILEDRILEIFKNISKNRILNLNISNMKIENNEEENILKDKINKLIIQKDRIMKAYEEEIYTLEEFKQRKSNIDLEIKKVTSVLEEILNKKDCENLKESIVSKCGEAYNVLKDQNVPIISKQKLIDRIIDKIIFDKNNRTFEVYYKGL